MSNCLTHKFLSDSLFLAILLTCVLCVLHKNTKKFNHSFHLILCIHKDYRKYSIYVMNFRNILIRLQYVKNNYSL